MHWKKASSQIIIRCQKNIKYEKIFTNNLNWYISEWIDPKKSIRFSNKKSSKKLLFELKMGFIVQIESKLQNFK